MTIDWNEIWLELRACFSSLADEVANAVPGVHTVFEQSSNDAFAFWGLVSFRREREPGDEVVTVSVDVRRDGEGLAASCYISGRGGASLADGPEARLSTPAEVTAWVVDVTRFVLSHRQTVIEGMASPA